MLMRITAAVTFAILMGGLVYLGGTVNAQAPAAHTSVDAAACGRLASLTLSNATVTSAQVVPAGTFKPPAGADAGFADLPAFCRVASTPTPPSDSHTKH